MGADKQMNLGFLFQISGVHYGGWRYPSAQPKRAADIRYYAEVVRTAERGKLDFCFLADSIAAYEGSAEKQDRSKEALMAAEPKRLLEPFTLLAALAMVTEHIGLVTTATTTYNEPYTIARLFASLDHISNGRAGWNVVTSANLAEAHNFGRDSHVEHGDRYARAEEFIDVVFKLWDSIEDGAYIRDKLAGQYGLSDKIHFINHVGEHFKVRGPLNVPRPPQGHPVIVQAGSSQPGKELAARTAEVVFTAQQTLADGKAFYSDVKGRMAKYGRSSDSLKILPGVVVYVAETESEAKAKYETVSNLVPPDFGLFMLSDLLGEIDLKQFDIDGPLPEDLPEAKGSQSRRDVIINLARRENLTIRQLYQHISGASGHRSLWGTPKQIADQFEQWVYEGAADGFNILPPYLPESMTDFVNFVVPELQRRGLFRTEYEGSTLRDRLGLARPKNSVAKPS
ncbi:MAG: LLM class flavin-dependent oxidoreductase [Rhizobiaceae bacterium]|uniref:Alkanesulfonate monooxygenase n=2 Tax=Hyphomicrobiales TaxID=356 RepID=A0A2V3TU35_9HYPH|nr:LLM class flavin-dependent oxidoreductase [Chelatococcus asaccharovorans]KAB2955977.1 MAG: LLM class flavin-dependent oxidoreductase [Rhizobiaceae bacterium]PXW51615.1 alkanesulfonate monooxygenase [Chelatococcus asaccharovorans]CAG1015402.1 alkanesulfonate monooxygenase [Rhizobiaceae bacterium]